jgi:large subunit ribosomal protein L29|tara:strand:- start:140 stop:340 length:201 start_codon:yes stop_codon:yes gene_type:complete
LKTKEIRTLGDEELKKRLEEAHKELLELRFKAATKQLKNHRELPMLKKNIACLKTIVRERELGIGV